MTMPYTYDTDRAPLWADSVRGELVTDPMAFSPTQPAQMDAGQPDYAIASSSLVALELCEGAYLSSAHRCRVTLPLSEFTPPPEPDWRPGQPYRGHGGRNGRELS